MNRRVPCCLYMSTTHGIYNYDSTDVNEDLSADKEPEEIFQRLIVTKEDQHKEANRNPCKHQASNAPALEDGRGLHGVKSLCVA
jgi:hypothetical protein